MSGIDSVRDKFINHIEDAAKAFMSDVREMMRAELRSELLRSLGIDMGDLQPQLPLDRPAAKSKPKKERPKAKAPEPSQPKGKIDQVVAFVKKHPGFRLELINARLGTTTESIRRQIDRAIASGRLQAKGYGRGRKYYPGRKA